MTGWSFHTIAAYAPVKHNRDTQHIKSCEILGRPRDLGRRVSSWEMYARSHGCAEALGGSFVLDESPSVPNTPGNGGSPAVVGIKDWPQMRFAIGRTGGVHDNFRQSGAGANNGAPGDCRYRCPRRVASAAILSAVPAARLKTLPKRRTSSHQVEPSRPMRSRIPPK